MQRIGEQINITIPDELKARIDHVAERHKLTRAETVRRLLFLGIEVYEEGEKFGIPQLAEIITRAKEGLRNYKQPRLV
jgi:metal-responsive CopG/Arc/MetJ family transcriptional regulator